MKVDPQLVPMASSEQLVRLRKVQQLLDEANNELTAQTSTEDNHG
jgi:multidrug efflux system membrane fusion protein